jgi:hypothetical protein
VTGMVKLAGLTARVSKHGTSYFAGYLGDVKVVVCEIRDRQEGDAETHAIYLAPVTPQAAQQAPQAAQQAPPPPKPAPRKTPKRAAPKRDAQAAMRNHPAFGGDWQRPLAKGPGDEGWDGLSDRDIGI